MKCYKNTNQITTFDDNYEFELPKYGKTTTDPTYYEPTATRIANMRKAASNGIALYDFDNADDVPNNISEIHVAPGRKPGMTKEEISQETTNIREKLESDISKSNSEKDNLNKQAEDIKYIQNSLNKSEDTSGNEAE